MLVKLWLAPLRRGAGLGCCQRRPVWISASAAARGLSTAREFVPSHYQEKIAEWVEEGTGHGMIDAKAGSGKTGTLVEVVAPR